MKQQNVQWHWGSGDLLWDSCFISDYKGKIVPSVQPGWQRITTLSLPAPSLSAISPNSPLWPGWGAKPQDLALRPTREFLSGQFEAGFCHSTSPPVSRGSGTRCESSLTDFPPWIMAWPPSSQAFWDHDVVKSHSLAGSGLINTRLIFGSTKGRVYWPNPVPGEDESKSPFAFTKVSFSNYLHPCSAPGHEKRCWALLSLRRGRAVVNSAPFRSNSSGLSHSSWARIQSILQLKEESCLFLLVLLQQKCETNLLAGFQLG